MSETVIVAVIAFFSGLVTLMTALIGYYKVLRPHAVQSGEPKRTRTVHEWIQELETRCRYLEGQVRELKEEARLLKQEVEECHRERRKLLQDRHNLLEENRELRSQISDSD